MRTTTRIAAVLAAGALAVGMSACNDQVAVEDPTGGSTQSETNGGGGSEGSAEAVNITDALFYDAEVGLTQTCDQIITDFSAPVYEATTSDTGTIVLMHCKIQTDELLINWNLDSNVTLDGANYQAAYPISPTAIADDLEDAGLTSITSGEGTTSTEGWIAMTFYEEIDITDGDWDIVYDRARYESDETGTTYNAYSETMALNFE